MKSRLLLLPAVGALLVGLAGCAAPTQESSPPPETTTAPVTTSSPTPTPTEESVDPRVEAVKADRQRFLNMSLDEFTALPDAEKVLFVALTNVAFFDEYESSYTKYPDAKDESVPDVGRDSDGQTISDFTTWQMRLATSFSGDEREKYIRAIAPGMGDSSLYLSLEEWSVAHPNAFQGFAAARNDLVPFVTVTQVFDAVDFQGSYSRRMMIGDFLAVYFYNEVTLPDGTVVPIWRRQ